MQRLVVAGCERAAGARYNRHGGDTRECGHSSELGL